ncbi:MAG: response regulator [bacterium]|nr:response regulator [bacterium]
MQTSTELPISIPIASPIATRTGSSVLIIDDSKLNRHVLSDLLRESGHRVTAVGDPESALAALGRHSFDLILLDLVLPGVQGSDFLERLLADEATRDTPIVVVSGVDRLDAAARCIELGAADFLLKPIEPVLLRARTNACLEQRHLRLKEREYLARIQAENDRKAAEIEHARQIQMSMLPASPPDNPLLEIAARQFCASEVGGDYYDFFQRQTPEGESLLCAIGDATGHGVGAGGMVAMTKALLLALNGGPDLPPLCEEMNRIMVRSGLREESNMALMLLEFCEMQASPGEARRLNVRATGGSMPPIYILKSNVDASDENGMRTAPARLEQIQICGVPLGLIDFDDITYDDIRFEVGAGDVIVLLSDGLPEMMNPADEMLDYDRLEERLTWIDPTASVEKILGDVLRIGDDWAEGEALKDDMTAVILKVRA